MCGIFAYFGERKNTVELAVKGLKKLEYRGYDSWGYACRLANGEIKTYKEVGKISDSKNVPVDFTTNMVMTHTRWATHGGVTEANCHPHASEEHEIVVVQNGIVDNYQEIKAELKQKGHIFTSDTDTEVFPHLVEEYLEEFGFEQACKRAMARLEGAMAFLVMSQDENKLIALRRGSPLIVGKGKDGEYFIASDTTPFAEYTTDVMYLDDDECVVIDNDGAKFYNLQTNSEIEKRIVEIVWDEKSVDKGDFDHFMMKEIMEQKNTIQQAINQNEEDLMALVDKINNAYGTFFIGCGTAGIVCLVGEYFFAQIAHKHINNVIASEFASYKHFLKDKSLILCITQSGETIDLVEAIKVAKKKGAQISTLVNVQGSTIYRMADFPFLINAGPEQAVASTKATTSQMAVLLLMAYATAGKLQEGQYLLVDAAGKINDMLNPRYIDFLHGLANQVAQKKDMFIIGKGANYPIALEAAMKIKEVSYIHAEGFPAGDLKHGHIALIEKGIPCIALVGEDEFKAEVINNCIEVKARGGVIIGVAPENNEAFDHWIKVPECGDAQPIINIIPIQILAYYLAVIKGKDPDKPRNLAKSVTVK